MDTTYKGFTFKKNTMISTNLAAIMMDPRNFEDPKKFDILRFIDSRTGDIKIKNI